MATKSLVHLSSKPSRLVYLARLPFWTLSQKKTKNLQYSDVQISFFLNGNTSWSVCIHPEWCIADLYQAPTRCKLFSLWSSAWRRVCGASASVLLDGWRPRVCRRVSQPAGVKPAQVGELPAIGAVDPIRLPSPRHASQLFSFGFSLLHIGVRNQSSLTCRHIVPRTVVERPLWWTGGTEPKKDNKP